MTSAEITYLERRLAWHEKKLKEYEAVNATLAIMTLAFIIAGIIFNPWIIALALWPLLAAGSKERRSKQQMLTQRIEELVKQLHEVKLRQEEDLDEWARLILGDQ